MSQGALIDRGTLALGGRRCTRSFSTYNLVMQCTEAMAMFPLPPRRMSRTDPIFLPPIVVDDSDDDAIMAVGSAASLSGFSLEFFEQPPPDSPMDWTPAAQPSTGEISAAQPSGEISSDDEDFAVDEDVLDLVALRNLVRSTVR